MSGLCATEAFFPHREIPTQAIFEFLHACAPPNVPATHPRANDSSFKGENLSPSVERVDRYLIITPADEDERLPRRLDILRSLQETVNDLSLFNRESAFPSYPDPFSLEELCKYADELFPGYNQPPGVLLPAAGPLPVDWTTPLPDYASPSSARSYDRDDEDCGAAQLTPPHITPRLAQNAALLDQRNPTAQVPWDDQPAPAVEPGAPAVVVPEITIPIYSYTSGESSSASDPSISPATPPHAQEVSLLPKPDVEGSQGPAIDDFTAAVEPSTDTVTVPAVATPKNNGALPICPSDVGPSTAPATPSVQEGALPDHHPQASLASANNSLAPAVERSATANATLNDATPEDAGPFHFFDAGSSTAPAAPAPAQEALLPVHDPQPTQEGSRDQPPAVRRVRGRPPKIPAPPEGQHSFIMYEPPASSPSTFPVAAPNISQALGNGASMLVYRDTLRDVIQYDPQDKARKAEVKAAKKSSGQ